MRLPCIISLPNFCWLFACVFSLGCVYLCSHLPCTFDGWVPILDFYLQGFSSTWLSVWKQINTSGVQINHPHRRKRCPAAIFRLWAWSWVTCSIITPYLAAFYNKMVTSHHHNHITSASLISWPNDRNHHGCHKDQLWLFECNWRAYYPV
jgi:hypothetical protein